jgi:hypothetical protein
VQSIKAGEPDMTLSIVINGNYLEAFTLNTTTHNSTFRPVDATKFGAAANFSYSCNSSFPFAHARDTLEFRDVLFQASIVAGQPIANPGLTPRVLATSADCLSGTNRYCAVSKIDASLVAGICIGLCMHYISRSTEPFQR